MTIRETIKKGMINLKTNGIEEPNLKARLLMQFILNKPRQYLLIYTKCSGVYRYMTQRTLVVQEDAVTESVKN